MSEDLVRPGSGARRYPDEYGWKTWDRQRRGRVFVHIVNSMTFREITGQEPPPTPVSARHYTEIGLPWFDLDDTDKDDLAPAEILAKVKPIKEIDADHGFAPQQDDQAIDIGPGQTKIVAADPSEVRDGPSW